MAGLAEAVSGEVQTGGGPFGQFARAQYSALASMRWSMFRNSLRSTQGAMEFGARSITTIIYTLMGLTVASGLGAIAFGAAAHGRWEILPVLLWVVFAMWQIVPITMASFQQQFDMGGLLRFPIGFGSFFLLHLIFGLVDLSTIMGSMCCLGIWIGVTVARPQLFAWAALALLAFAIFNLFMARAIFAWIDRWLAQRRTREIISALFLFGILGLNLVNPAFHAEKTKMSAHTREQGLHWLHTASAVQQWLPPGLAARAMHPHEEGGTVPWAENLALLGIYLGACGATLGIRLRAEFRGENLGEAPARNKVERRREQWLLGGSGLISAVIEKDIRTLLRALPLLYGLAMPLVMVFVFAGLFKGKSIQWALLICLAYTVLGFMQLMYNNLGTEGAGIQLFFLMPTPIRTVILAKNLLHASLLVVEAALVCLLVFVRYGPQPLDLMMAAWAWIVFAVPLNLTVGNVFSIHMPYRVNLGRIGRQRGSQSNALFAMLVQTGALGVGAGAIGLCHFFGQLWLATPILLVFAAGAAIAYFRVLANADRMANNRREDIIAELVRTE